MAVKKESVEIKCPDCKIEFRLWVPTTHLTLWEGDDGERVNCVRCPTHFKIRKTIDGVKVFKLQRTVVDTGSTAAAAPEPSSAPAEDAAPTPAQAGPDKTDEPSAILSDENGGSDVAIAEKPVESVEEETAPETEEEHIETEIPEEPEKAPEEEPQDSETLEETKEEDKPLIDIDDITDQPPEAAAPIIEEVEEEILELDAVKIEQVSTMGLSQHGETVLLVEDESLSRAVAENSLIDLNITLLTAEDGKVAIDILNDKHIDLLITDLHLSSDENQHPRIDGENILQVLADKGLGIPAIVTTGKEMIDDIAMNPKWFPLNVKGFVQKGSPFWSEELKDKIKEIINKPG